MRSILLTLALTITASVGYTQALSYAPLSVLFSKSQNDGTARFNSMGGAFGALGSDISSLNVNPAGGVVARKSFFSATLKSQNREVTSTYYGNSTKYQTDFFTLSQIGGTLIYNDNPKLDWNRFAVSFNYNQSNNFNDGFIAQGNGGFNSFYEFPLDGKTYDSTDNQKLSHITDGKLNEYTIGFSSVYQNKLFVGFALNISSLTYRERNLLTEQNNDGTTTNTMTADFYQENNITGSGFSINFGVIYKAYQNLRFGVSYRTPTWFSDITELNNIFNKNGVYGNLMMETNTNDNIYINFNGYLRTINPDDSNQLTYRLKTPGKLTLSSAFLFGKKGLISLDYSLESYKKIRFSDGDFTKENEFVSSNLKNVSSINIGGEWRIKQFSVRSGYRYEQSPSKNAISSDNLNRYSFGAGYNFGAIKIDLSYSISNQTGIYELYPNRKKRNLIPASLKNDNSNFTATVSFNL